MEMKKASIYSKRRRSCPEQGSFFLVWKEITLAKPNLSVYFMIEITHHMKL